MQNINSYFLNSSIFQMQNIGLGSKLGLASTDFILRPDRDPWRTPNAKKMFISDTLINLKLLCLLGWGDSIQLMIIGGMSSMIYYTLTTEIIDLHNGTHHCLNSTLILPFPLTLFRGAFKNY